MTKTAVARATRYPSSLRSCWKGEISAAAFRDFAASPNRVLGPVPTANATASPVWHTAPRKSALLASAAVCPFTSPGRLTTP